MNFSGSRDRGDEGRLEAAAKPLDFRKGGSEDIRHFLAGQVAGNEGELPHSMFFQRPFFKQVVADLLVAGEKGPSPLTHQREPCFVRCPAEEMAEMALESDVERFQSVENRLRVAEILVEVQDELFRRRWGGPAPSGWLLRFGGACTHTPRRDPDRIPAR